MTIDELFELLKKKYDVTRDGNTLSAGGDLHLRSLTTLPEGVTLSAGGYLYLSSLTTLPEGVTLSALQVLGNFRQTYRGESLEPIDGTVMAMGEAHQVGAATVCAARYLGSPAESEKCFVAKVGEHTAHGATAREAIEDATAKAGPADVAGIVAEIKKTGVVNRAQYRALTGACREGVRQWCRTHNVADDVESLPLADVLRLTSGNYGGERLAAVIQAAT